jgi:hypothetical protein
VGICAVFNQREMLTLVMGTSSSKNYFLPFMILVSDKNIRSLKLKS